MLNICSNGEDRVHFFFLAIAATGPVTPPDNIIQRLRNNYYIYYSYKKTYRIAFNHGLRVTDLNP
jgi:hypothetical protein